MAKYECFAESTVTSSIAKICETSSLVEARKRAMGYARIYVGRKLRFFAKDGPEVGQMLQLINDQFVWFDHKTGKGSYVQKDGKLGRRA